MLHLTSHTRMRFHSANLPMYPCPPLESQYTAKVARRNVAVYDGKFAIGNMSSFNNHCKACLCGLLSLESRATPPSGLFLAKNSSRLRIVGEDVGESVATVGAAVVGLGDGAIVAFCVDESIGLGLLLSSSCRKESTRPAARPIQAINSKQKTVQTRLSRYKVMHGTSLVSIVLGMESGLD